MKKLTTSISIWPPFISSILAGIRGHNVWKMDDRGMLDMDSQRLTMNINDGVTCNIQKFCELFAENFSTSSREIRLELFMYGYGAAHIYKLSSVSAVYISLTSSTTIHNDQATHGAVRPRSANISNFNSGPAPTFHSKCILREHKALWANVKPSSKLKARIWTWKILHTKMRNSTNVDAFNHHAACKWTCLLLLIHI